MKIIDFGSASSLKKGEYKVFRGTREYAPPEWIKNGAYTADGLNVWSLGILLHALIMGDVPFHSDNEIMEADLLGYKKKLLEEPGTRKVSRVLSSFVHTLLNGRWKERIQMAELEDHHWIIDGSHV